MFGTIRYLPADLGLRHLLSQVRFESPSGQVGWSTVLKGLSAYDTEYKFWPRHIEGEIDLLLESHLTLIGVEVKYFSYLSSEDEDLEADFNPETSQNQLVRYARMMQRIGGAKSKYLVFLAPLATVTQVKAVMKPRGSIASYVSIGYLSWQEVLEALQRIDLEPLDRWQRLILEDVMGLLVKKHFVRFGGFASELETVKLTQAAYQFEVSPRKSLWPTQTIREELAYVYDRGGR